MLSKITCALLIPILVLGLAGACLGAHAARDTVSTSRRGLSIAQLEPDAKDRLAAQGKGQRTEFPNSINRGRKFNPSGEAIPALDMGQAQKVITLFIDFQTSPPGGPETRLDLSLFDDLLFGTTYDPPQYAEAGYGSGDYPIDRTLKNYYDETTFGQVDVTTDDMPSDIGWVHSERPYDYYCRADGIHDNGFGPYPENVQGLVIEAINKAHEQGVDFSEYAVDGVVPNLMVVFAGTGAEWSGAYDIIWSHSWDLTEGTGMDGYEIDGVKINSYAMMPEVGGDLTGFAGPVDDPPYPPTVGVFAHEYAHVLGLPDQYDYGYESEGTGNFSLMAGGSWNRYPKERVFSGNSPALLDAWSKYRLGVIDVVEVTDATDVALDPAETSPEAYKMVVPGSGGREYFLFENRQNIGFDEGLLFRYRLPDGTLAADPLHGLAVYHVDDTVFSRNYWRPNEAQNWLETRSAGFKRADTGETHYAISMLQADDRWDLEHGRNRGDTGDLYPGSAGVTSIGNFTKPNTTAYYFWPGLAPKFGYSGVNVSNIVERSDGVVTAGLSFVPWTAPRK